MKRRLFPNIKLFLLSPETYVRLTGGKGRISNSGENLVSGNLGWHSVAVLGAWCVEAGGYI